jgi:hypothetical protein
MTQVFRAVQNLLLGAVHNPFLSLSRSFRAQPAGEAEAEAKEVAKIVNPPIKDGSMFSFGPDGIRPEWLKESEKFQRGVERIGELLSGGRG